MKKILFTFVALVCSFSVWAQASVTEFDVTVTARDNSSDVQDKVNNAADKFDAMADVVKLKVAGTINSYDLMIMRSKMINLEELDLRDADIVYNSYEYYTGYHSEDNVLGPNVFRECSNLKKVILPRNATIIGNLAFFGCKNLHTVELPEKLIKIGKEAFYACSSLKDIEFPQNLSIIESYAFAYCYSLETINLPTNLQTINFWAFYGCTKLKVVKIPVSVSSIGSSAFEGCPLTDVYTWTIVPTQIDQTTFSNYQTATLHVPTASKKLYYWDTEWSQFVNVVEFDEPYEYFYLSDRKDLEMGEDDARIDGKPDADFNAGSGLVVEGSTSQTLDEVNLESNGDNTGSIVGEGAEGSGNVNINDLKIQIAITSGKWYFFAFPFDIDYNKIHFDGQFVWRYYDGEYRAANGSGAWKNVSGNLEAGKGYIFQASKSGTLTLNIGQVSIGGEDKILALESHTSANAQDASWNLVGNPYTSYYELSDLGYNAPITVWNGSSYTAYSPTDDDLTLYPFQAFFVQKTTDAEGVGFEAEARETRNKSLDPNHQSATKARRAARRAPRQELRELINLELSDGESADKTRIVFNNAKSDDYEIECDAAKFFTNGVTQLYTLDAKNVQYAINERPVGTGTVRMGFCAPKAGEYTIAATRMDCPVLLRDLTTGVTHDLANGSYTFTSEAGDFAYRFELVNGNATGIANIETSEEGAKEYYRLDGVKSNANANGVLIEKGKSRAKKVVKKQ